LAFGDIFQYERDLSYDAFQCSTPVSTPILDDRRIFRAACNDSICLAKGDKGPNAWAVESHYSFDSDNGQPYYVEEYFTCPTKKPDSYFYDYSSVFEESDSDTGPSPLRCSSPSTSRLRDAIFQRGKLYKDPSTTKHFAFRIKLNDLH
jgi:hypothetical protein